MDISVTVADETIQGISANSNDNYQSSVDNTEIIERNVEIVDGLREITVGVKDSKNEVHLLGEGFVGSSNPYEGPYEVDPSELVQVLPTTGKTMLDDVTVYSAPQVEFNSTSKVLKLF